MSHVASVENSESDRANVVFFVVLFSVLSTCGHVEFFANICFPFFFGTEIRFLGKIHLC